jgi:predicted metalloprotease
VAFDHEQANDYSVRLELRADCFAVVWASTLYVHPSRSAEVGGSEALEAAAAVEDDRTQEATTGRIDPENFSHGTSAQRQEWFNRGYQTGDPNQCNTFSADL